MSLKALALVALVVATVAAYADVRTHDFVNYDDPGYVTANPRVQDGLTVANVRWAFTTDTMANWHPLTWLSHMLDVEMFGLDAGGHHLTSVALHALNTVLLFVFLHTATGAPWPSLAVAALFALHPLHVESVAWIAERKDVLSTAFAFGTLLVWVRWTRVPSVSRYGLVFLLFALGLAAKPMLVTLPALLLLLDVWPLARRRPWWALVVEKLPLFALAATSSVVTLLVQQRGGAVRSTAELAIRDRLGNAVLACVGYLTHGIWPADLAPFYPIHLPLPLGRVAGAIVILLAITAVVLWARPRQYVVGWLWFVGMLVPVLGLVQVGPQAMADRYTYVPLVGVFVMVAWGVADIVARRPGLAPLATVITGVVLGACFVQTRTQVSYWRDSRTLFEHALAVTRDNHIAHANLAAALADAGDGEAALEHWRAALRITPHFVEVHTILGARALDAGRIDEAAEHFEAAVRHGPMLVGAQVNLAIVRGRQGRHADAARALEAAVAMAPARADLQGDLGLALAEIGRDADAEFHYREAMRLDPTVVGPRINLAGVLRRTQRLDEARVLLTEVLAVAPGDADAEYMLGNVLVQLGRPDEAAAHYRNALAARPRFAAAANNLGLVLVAAGRLDEAISRFTEALETDPSFAPAYANRARAYGIRGDAARGAADRAHASALEASSPTP